MDAVTQDEKAVAPETGETFVYRHRRAARIWHWLNAITVFVLLMSGLMIFNAHPRLYWGKYGANQDRPWLQIGAEQARGYLRVGTIEVTTTGLLGRWTDSKGAAQNRAFPDWATIPSHYDLAGARSWHFLFAWLLVVPGLGFWAWSLAGRHLQRDLLPSRDELSPRHIWKDIKDHARLRFAVGEQGRRYNILQKLSYLIVIFVLLPMIAMTGLTMSPAMNAAWPWLLDLFGGRQSARSLHFIFAALILGFILVHLVMILLAGPYNEIRSMISGRYRLRPDKTK